MGGRLSVEKITVDAHASAQHSQRWRCSAADGISNSTAISVVNKTFGRWTPSFRFHIFVIIIIIVRSRTVFTDRISTFISYEISVYNCSRHNRYQYHTHYLVRALVLFCAYSNRRLSGGKSKKNISSQQPITTDVRDSEINRNTTVMENFTEVNHEKYRLTYTAVCSRLSQNVRRLEQRQWCAIYRTFSIDVRYKTA